MKMTQEQINNLMVSARARHARLVSRILTVPLLRAHVTKPMSPTKVAGKIVRAKPELPEAIDA
jgi:hypothetical protein